MLYSSPLQRRISITVLLCFVALCTGLPFHILAGGIAKAAPGTIAHSAADESTAPDASLTIYNQNFAVVRQSLPLQLLPGVNSVQFTDTTAHVETDSVILRDPSGQHHLQVLEQSYRADPISEQFLLSLNEGKVIEFESHLGAEKHIIEGKVIRSGYAHPYSQTGQMQPIIEYGG